MSQQAINSQQVNFHTTSFCDPDGRLFWWNNGLYRGISASHEAFVRDLFEKKIPERLIDRGYLVDTTFTDLTLEGYPLVLQHQVLPFVSYGNEWSFDMLRDAALLVCNMLEELAKEQLVTDADTWDILFDGCHPVYVDFCSIVALNQDSTCQHQLLEDDFYSYFVLPLQLMSSGRGNLARWLLADYYHECIHAEFASLMGKQIYGHVTRQSVSTNSFLLKLEPIMQGGKKLLDRSIRTIHKVSGNSLLSQSNQYDSQLAVAKFRESIDVISAPKSPQVDERLSEWNAQVTPSSEWCAKRKAIFQHLNELSPKTLLDIGCGGGWYAKLAASLGINVIALDKDEHAVNHCYRSAKDDNYDSILPFVMDIGRPSSGDGVCSQTIEPALQRISCDMVLAIDLLHWMAEEQNYTAQQIGETLAVVTKRWLLIEILVANSTKRKVALGDLPNWYSFDAISDTLAQYFRSLTTIPLGNEESVLLLCEK